MILILKAGYDDLKRLAREDDGAAFIVTLGVFMFMFMLCIGVYAIGDTVRRKIELQNAADAASYSAAVVQADTLSRIATINRAMAWTYIQMTRRQMDFITDRWLKRTVKVWNDDYDAVKFWHNLSCFISYTTGTFKIPGIPAPGPGCDFGHNTQKSDTYWVGVNEGSHGIVHLNGLSAVFTDNVPGLNSIQQIPVLNDMGFGRDVDISDIKQSRSAFANHAKLSFDSGNNAVMIVSDIGAQILSDKANILAMNIAEIDLLQNMPDRIRAAVNDIIHANLPDEDKDNERVQFYLYQNEHPYSYFRILNNTRDDERIFLSFADCYDPQHKAFRGKIDNSVLGLAKKANDAASWLKLTAMDSKLFSRGFGDISGGIDRWFVRGDGKRRAKDSDFGIQRCYKTWPEDILHSFHPSKYIPILPPTCFNFNGDDNSASQLTSYKFNRNNPLPSIGLYSEWRWYSMIWFCYSAPIIPWYPMNHSHTDICSMFWCQHTSLDTKIRNGLNCMIWPQNSIHRRKTYKKLTFKHGRPRWKTKAINTGGKSITNLGLPVIGGYTRVYGDDSKIYDEKYYVGAKCMPLILSPSFFGKPGSLVVAISAKNENPFVRVLNYVSGIFRGFDPAVSHTWAVSAARAAYHKFGYGKKGEYQLCWSDPDDLRERWNMKQPDWDAVFLPVRDAWKMSAWDMFVPGSESVFGTGPGTVFEDMVNSNYGRSQGWRRVNSPEGMDGDYLDWKNLTDYLVH